MIGDGSATTVMGGDEHCGPVLVGEVGQHRPDQVGVGRVEVCRGLVGQHESGTTDTNGHEGSGDLHATQLATREFVDTTQCIGAEVDVGQRRQHDVVRRRCRCSNLVDDERSGRHETLADHGQLACPRCRVEFVDIDPGQRDRTGPVEQPSSARFHQCRLARPARSVHSGERAREEVEVHSAEESSAATPQRDVADFQPTRRRGGQVTDRQRGSCEQLVEIVRRIEPRLGGVKARAHAAQRQVALGRQEQHHQRGVQVEAAAGESQADLDSDEGDGQRRDQLEARAPTRRRSAAPPAWWSGTARTPRAPSRAAPRRGRTAAVSASPRSRRGSGRRGVGEPPTGGRFSARSSGRSAP